MVDLSYQVYRHDLFILMTRPGILKDLYLFISNTRGSRRWLFDIFILYNYMYMPMFPYSYSQILESSVVLSIANTKGGIFHYIFIL